MTLISSLCKVFDNRKDAENYCEKLNKEIRCMAYIREVNFTDGKKFDVNVYNLMG